LVVRGCREAPGSGNERTAVNADANLVIGHILITDGEMPEAISHAGNRSLDFLETAGAVDTEPSALDAGLVDVPVACAGSESGLRNQAPVIGVCRLEPASHSEIDVAGLQSGIAGDAQILRVRHIEVARTSSQDDGSAGLRRRTT
jgi:hypothetical protein